VHQAVLRAALELLAERGWSGLTMEGVAARAGTAKGTVYRWWSSKEDLVVEALVVHGAPYRPAPDTGSFQDDMVSVLEALVRALKEPGALLLASLVSETARNEQLADAFQQHLIRTRRAHLLDIAERAVARGEIRDDIDMAYLVDQGVAYLLYRFLVSHEPLDDDLPRRITDEMMRGAAPR
jgi:AcrR family transcriptional regulator